MDEIRRPWDHGIVSCGTKQNFKQSIFFSIGNSLLFCHPLQDSSALDLNIGVVRQSLDSNATVHHRIHVSDRIFPLVQANGKDSRPTGLDITPVGGVDLVHGSEVVHAGEEDVDLDNVVEVGAGGLEDGAQVLDAAVGVRLHVTGNDLAIEVLEGAKMISQANPRKVVFFGGGRKEHTVGVAPLTKTKPPALMAWL